MPIIVRMQIVVGKERIDMIAIGLVIASALIVIKIGITRTAL